MGKVKPYVQYIQFTGSLFFTLQGGDIYIPDEEFLETCWIALSVLILVLNPVWIIVVYGDEYYHR